MKNIEINLNKLFSSIGFDVSVKENLLYDQNIEETIKHFCYWTFNNTLKELNDIIEEIGHFPSQKELLKIKKSTLINAMRKYGGVKRFREIVNLKDTRNEIGHYTREVILSEIIVKRYKAASIRKKSSIFSFSNTDIEFPFVTVGLTSSNNCN